ncbi:hypothetical protein UPYG_G00194400 [Umbra pygmaea]|uniref:Uncharacterized protein n=1 Tax=Umbra pygmaea TaxID=75934 RepID=A0ABD0X2Z2_UMBPY
MSRVVLLANLLLIWAIVVFLDCIEGAELKIKVEESAGKVTLSCVDSSFSVYNKDNKIVSSLEYNDEKSGEYTCKEKEDEIDPKDKIYVKFRKCDNCVELDMTATVGMVIGDLVATVLIGVAVYYIASQPRATLGTSKKASSQMVLIQNEAGAQSDSGGHYQRLNKRRQDTSEYSTLADRR